MALSSVVYHGSLALVLFAGLAHAQPRVQPAPPAEAQPAPDTLPALVAGLDSPDLQVRSSAQQALLDRSDIPLRQIEEVLKAGGLSPEQHRRLLSVAWERFKSEPRPAMGVQTNQMQQRGTVLDFITPGFPAHGVLKAGDRIESADGVRLDDFTLLRHVILSRDPGDEMALVIVREGAVLNLNVRLGRYSDLRNPMLDEGSLLASFRRFRARDYLQYNPDEPPLESGLAPEDWSLAELAVQHGDPAYADYGEIDGSQSGMPVVAGGEPRAGIIITPARASRNFRVRGVDADMAQDELGTLLFRQQQIQAIIQANRMRMNDRTIAAESRDMLRQLNERYSQELKAIDARIRELRGR